MSEHPPPPLDFAAEFLRHHRSLWLVAKSILPSSADADDVLQEAAIIGLHKAATFTPGTSFRGWMGAIVRNTARNRRRQVRRDSARFSSAIDPNDSDLRQPTSHASPVTADGSIRPLQDALDDTLLAALAQLDPIARACLLLRCIEGLEYAAISQLLGIPEGTVMSHVFRCRRCLATSLSPTPPGHR